MKLAAALFFCLALVSGSAAAHHSTAEYDRSTLRELEGELTEVRWRNPHVMVKLRTAKRRRSSGGLGARGSTDLAARGSRAHGQSVLRSHRPARQGGRVAVANARFDAR